MAVTCQGFCDTEWMVHDNPDCPLYEGNHPSAYEALLGLRVRLTDDGFDCWCIPLRDGGRTHWDQCIAARTATRNAP